MVPTRRPSASSLKKLRHFRYQPSMGGMGGDWDTLEASLPFADETDLRALLARLGWEVELPPPCARRELGTLAIDGVPVEVAVLTEAHRADAGNTLRMTLAVYVTQDDVDRALRLDGWLDANLGSPTREPRLHRS